MTKKSIVLSDVEKTNKKAVLTMEEKNGKVSGMVRLYNFSREVQGIISLGIYFDRKVEKCGLTKCGKDCFEFFANISKIPTSFSCAVVNIVNAQPKPILFGSSQGNNDEIYGQIIEEISQKNTYQNTKEVLDRYEIDFDEDEKAEIEKEIDKNLCEGICENCVYKKEYLKAQENSKNLHTDAVFEEKTQKNPQFFEKLKPQIDKMFDKNPVEENLQNIIPNSKWVRVDCDEGDFYVFGIVYDKNQIAKFVCYGVPAIYEENPPEEVTGFPFFVPLSEGKSDGFGYWLSFQDAQTGEPVDVSN
jgi:hypothetical protein